MSTPDFDDAMLEALLVDELAELISRDTDDERVYVATFADAGIMTRNLGVVVTLGNGRTFQLQINGSYRSDRS